MLPFLRITRRRIILSSSLLALIFVLAYYFGGYFIHRNTPNPQINTEVVKDNQIRVTPDTDLIHKVIYLQCGDEELFRTKPAANLVGLNISQVQGVYTGWTIDKFDSQVVELSRKVDRYCPEHARNSFIGIKDGMVAVFYGKPGPKAIVKEITKIPVSRLSSEDAAEIGKGLPVQTQEELLRILEGMQSAER